MKLLLVYPPFCPPTIMPYSLSYLKGFLKKTLPTLEVQCLDLNAKFHSLQFPKLYTELKEKNEDSLTHLGNVLEKCAAISRETMVKNNRTVVDGKHPEAFDKLLKLILEQKPDYVGLSFVYSSQCFYGKVLLKELEKRRIKCVIGGPAVPMKMTKQHTFLGNEKEMLNYFSGKLKHEIPELEKNITLNIIPDFSDYNQKEYVSKVAILPLKTSNTCFYKQCTFCTHFAKVPYAEVSLEVIKEAIIRNKAKYVFFIDDMISTPRLLEIAKALQSLNVKWWCQLRPTKDLLGKLKELYDSGLRSVSWGVESGNQSVLDAIKKGTNVEDIEKVLAESKNIGIINIAYIMFGFPGETREGFLETISFLERNDQNLDLLSTSTFGLQRGSKVYQNPKLFHVKNICKEKRTVLDEKITFQTTQGLNEKELQKLRKGYRKTINNINKLPKSFACYKEQILAVVK